MKLNKTNIFKLIILLALSTQANLSNASILSSLKNYLSSLLQSDTQVIEEAQKKCQKLLTKQYEQIARKLHNSFKNCQRTDIADYYNIFYNSLINKSDQETNRTIDSIIDRYTNETALKEITPDLKKYHYDFRQLTVLINNDITSLQISQRLLEKRYNNGKNDKFENALLNIKEFIFKLRLLDAFTKKHSTFFNPYMTLIEISSMYTDVVDLLRNYPQQNYIDTNLARQLVGFARANFGPNSPCKTCVKAIGENINKLDIQMNNLKNNAKPTAQQLSVLANHEITNTGIIKYKALFTELNELKVNLEKAKKHIMSTNEYQKERNI